MMRTVFFKKALAVAASAILASAFLTVKADEGMWLPSLISQRIGDMQAKGFRLSAEDIYSINQASLKDAVVLFGGGCTGELISSEGLLLTNHHCGYAQIQKHSSVEHDYLKDGFWAMDRSEELPNPGLEVWFLDRMEDVTGAVLDGYEPGMTEQQRDSVVRTNSEAIAGKAEKDGTGLRADVESLYYGNQYFLFVYRVFKDVRLVGAPPSSIGKFGGDTDNWMWPRHTGDFSIFRIYADKDNNPAEYSEDNVPYIPKKYFKISLGGVSEGDFTFIYGFPGRTQEYIVSEAVRYISEISDPHKIALRTLRLDIQDRYMSASQAVRIQYSSKNAAVSNSWKKWQGEMRGIRKMNTVETKKENERLFEEWAVGSEYSGIVGRLDSLYRLMEPYAFAADYYNETARAIELTSFAAEYAKRLEKAAGASSPDEATQARESAKRLAAAFYKDYYMPIDKESFIALMDMFDRNIPSGFKPEYFTESMGRYGSAEAWADSLFGNSVFSDSSALTKTVAAACADGVGTDITLLTDDPAVEFGNEFRKWYMEGIRSVVQRLGSKITLLYRDYMKGQMEFNKDRAFYPDANLTLRVAYGSVQGYSPADGTYYLPMSTIEGIMQKDNPDIFDYNIPQRLRDIYAEKDYGEWTVTDASGRLTVPVCFIATNHTSGGNSGSPVINADGDLIGINFDRVWEGTMSDIVFDPDLCRNISLDIRYVLFIIDKVAGAGHLIDEMTFTD